MIYRPLWIELDLKALAHNFRAIRRYVGKDVKIVATIKQNAYGHGLLPIARRLAFQGADFFALEGIEEAMILRKAGFKQPILILTAILPQFAKAIIDHRLTPTLVDLEFARKLNSEAAKNKITVSAHVKIDTGMGRLGPSYKEATSFILNLQKLKNIKIEGIYTHFPVADTDRDYTQKQTQIFNDFISQMEGCGVEFKYRHCANSAAIMGHKSAHFNMVRPGLILYGLSPFENIPFDIKPVLSLKSRIIFIKNVKKNDTVSYGRTYHIKKPGRIATIAAGYADGYQRSLSNKAKVIINNKLFAVAGRICMDHTMIDINQDKKVKVGDEVILIGRSQKHRVSAEELAQLANTIPYEITTCLSTRIPRIIKNA
jgi:alanine racemase